MLLCAGLAMVVAASPLLDDPGEVPLTQQTRTLMHTPVTIAFAEPPAQGRADHLDDFARGFEIFEHIDATLNEWRPESPLSAINAAAGKEPVTASRELCEVIALSLDGARRTGGLFDPTWAALRGLWRFGSEAVSQIPPAEGLRERCALVSWREVSLVPLARPSAEEACTVGLTREGMALGLGGLVKGWGVDRVVKLLRARGYRNFYVQAGGDLYAAGKRGGRPWRVGIREPRAEGTFAQLQLSDRAFSTSGDYERFFEKDGVRYHHLLDPRDCQPARASVSCSVLALTATEAEFLTKAAFILGPKAGLALVEKQGAAAVLVTPDGAVHASKQLQRRLQQSPPRGFGTAPAR